MPGLNDLITRKPKIGRPVPNPTSANVNYPNTPIVIQTPNSPQRPDTDTIQTIKLKLDEIGSTTVGANLFVALQNAGKPIGVRYSGPNNNSAAGAMRGYVLLRAKHDSGDRAGFGAELNMTLQRVVRSMDVRTWLAGALRTQLVPTWQGNTIQPFQGKSATEVSESIDDWTAGNSLPTNDEADAIMLVLKDYLRPGPGVSTRISFDTQKEIVNGQARPPCVGLFHELMHAYYYAIGGQLGREDSQNEGNGGRLFEAMAVGLGEFDTAPFSENAFRRALNVSRRTTYP